MTSVGSVWSPEGPRIDELPSERRLGTFAVWLVIVTEALLFVALLFAYFYTAHGQPAWPPHPPKTTTALVLLGILLVSSATLEGAKHAAVRGHERFARVGLALTIGLGLGFLALQAREMVHRLAEVRPSTDAYGSLFFAITGFHAAHVIAGVLLLVGVACLPRLRSTESPHRPVENVALYWHFVDVVWLLLVVVLYLVPGVSS
jgi:heme/copper-type cytochrome/quinol oxidase subunit 3